jgi:hypothetical protein
VEGIRAQYLAVGGHHEGVEGGKFVAKFGYAGRLFEGEVVLAGEFGDGSPYRLASAASAGVGL